MKALVCLRDYGVKNYVNTIDNLTQLTEAFFMGEKLSVDIDNYFELKVKLLPELLLNDLVFLDIASIIKRDRMLREIDVSIAKKIVISITNQIYNNFLDIKPNLVIGQLVDYYILDITYKIAEYLNIKIISFLDGWIDNTFGLSKYGEVSPIGNLNIDFFEYFKNKNQHSEVSQVDKVSPIRLFLSGVKSDFNLYKKKLMNYNEYCNYNYAIYTNVEKIHPQLNKWSCFSHLYFNKIDILNNIDKENTVYIPLHFYPEAVIDYWINNIELIDYENLLIKLFKSNKNITFVVKEHPALFRRRNYSFYKKLKDIGNVVLLFPNIRTFEVFEKIDFVFTWTGTTGLEAIFYQKKVITVEETFYDIPEISKVRDINDLSSFKNVMDNAKTASNESLNMLNSKLQKSFVTGPFIENVNKNNLEEFTHTLDIIIGEIK